MMWKTVSRPTTLDQALRELRNAPPRTRLIAGATDVIVEQQRGVRPAEHLIDLTGIWDLRYVRQDGDIVRIGALATHNDVLRAHDVRDALLPLAQACIEVGAPQIRARATIAGNVVTASPANDTIVPLIALGAEIVLANADGTRALPLEEFYTGFRATVLRPDEIVREIRFPALDVERRGIFLKLGLRRAQAISVVNVAVVLRFDGLKIEEASIAIGCVGPTIVRAPEAEGVLMGNKLDSATIEHAAKLAVEAIAPISDLRGSADYRRRTVDALVTQALETLADGSEADLFPDDPVLLETDSPVRAALEFDGLIEATVNGDPCTLENAQQKTLLNALRDYGLTGSKEGCAEGECGACTVWLDGQAVMSCLVPAAQAHGANVTTIEGLASGERLHPLQQAYIDRGSVQCGFCIPGMLMAGAKFMEERATPSLEDAQIAISGNLCRCTGYRKILDAMDETIVKLEKPRPDALEKVNGTALYPADLIQPGMLHAAAVFAHRAHARIRRIDSSAATALEGVHAVLRAQDVPYNRFGLIDADQPLLCEDIVRFYGDRVALVVADSAELAREAAALVRVEYEDLPPLTDPRAAIEADAPRVHADRENVLLHQKVVHGPQIDEALQSADVVIEATFTTGWQEHAYLQPDAAIAYWEDERLVVETAGQWLHEDRRQLAALFTLQEDDVVVRYAKIGGAFGGREDLALTPLVALAAWKLKRAVAMTWTRDESIIGHHKRHPFRISATWGAMRDGRIVAAKTSMLGDGGAYASTSAEVLKCALTFATGPYRIESVETDACVTYTNNIPCGAFRGFGSPQAHFAAESMVTRLAHALEIDPIEMRRKNLYREGDIEPTGEPLPEGVSAQAVFERCIKEVGVRMSPSRSQEPHLKRGLGIACGMKNVGYSFGFPDQATATVELSVAGDQLRGASVAIGAAEVGQGSHTILRQIAAKALSVDVNLVRMIVDDSSLAPNAGSASASRMTLFGGRAVKDACDAALQAWRNGEAPRATVQYLPGGTTALDPQTGHGTPHFCYGYAAQAVEVEVDTRTGVTRVLRIISVHDVGRAINRQLVEGQIEGCLAQAVGYALTENFISTDGKIQTPYFSTYLLPTTLDMPAQVYPVILENPDPNGPFGARGVAEMPLIPFAPAVAAAIHDATGAWVSDLPMTPERVLRALDQIRDLDQVEIGITHVNGANGPLRTGLGNGALQNGDTVRAQTIDDGIERNRGQEAEIP
ncbi:MAG TPA: molybdopterin cofactor-binding domain-containing protein [Candidatus Acidoferrales bacterium]|nr:molybdopterin cofactor-binding domain-containing protein [Candidatus Acidoferrales bacterium]